MRQLSYFLWLLFSHINHTRSAYTERPDCEILSASLTNFVILCTTVTNASLFPSRIVVFVLSCSVFCIHNSWRDCLHSERCLCILPWSQLNKFVWSSLEWFCSHVANLASLYSSNSFRDVVCKSDDWWKLVMQTILPSPLLLHLCGSQSHEHSHRKTIRDFDSKHSSRTIVLSIKSIIQGTAEER